MKLSGNVVNCIPTDLKCILVSVLVNYFTHRQYYKTHSAVVRELYQTCSRGLEHAKQVGLGMGHIQNQLTLPGVHGGTQGGALGCLRRSLYTDAEVKSIIKALSQAVETALAAPSAAPGFMLGVEKESIES